MPTPRKLVIYLVVSLAAFAMLAVIFPEKWLIILITLLFGCAITDRLIDGKLFVDQRSVCSTPKFLILLICSVLLVYFSIGWMRQGEFHVRARSQVASAETLVTLAASPVRFWFISTLTLLAGCSGITYVFVSFVRSLPRVEEKKPSSQPKPPKRRD
jgi:hypothetical protein